MATKEKTKGNADKQAQAAEANGTAAESKKKVEKTTCPVTRDQFRAKAPRLLDVVIGGKAKQAEYKEFSTGSMGWFLNEKVTIEVDGIPCTVQIGLNLTVVGSKELPKPSE